MNECKRQSNWKTFKDDDEAAAASFNKCLLSRRRELHFQGNGKFFSKWFLRSPHCAVVHQSASMVQDTTTNSTFHNYFISVLLLFLRTSTVSGNGMCVNIWTSRYWKLIHCCRTHGKMERMKKGCTLADAAHAHTHIRIQIKQIQTQTYKQEVFCGAFE